MLQIVSLSLPAKSKQVEDWHDSLDVTLRLAQCDI